MSENIYGDLDASIQEKMDGDTDFQTSLESLTDEQKTEKISERKTADMNTALGELKGKTTKAEEVANNQKIRAEKAENLLKGSKKEVKTDEEIKAEAKKSSNSDNLSQLDLIAIIKAEVPTEDISDVTDYAELKGISVIEALKSSVVKTILKEKAEERTTAEATSTGSSKRGSSKVSDESLLSEYDKGNLPESDKDMERLVQLQIKGDTANA